MKLTIIPADEAVYKDGQSYLELNLASCNIPENVHALQWNNDSGWIEFKDSSPNEELTELPTWANSCLTVWEAKDYLVKNPPPPTEEEILLANTYKAKGLLQQSDWTQMSDVNLVNIDEWNTYRSALRVIATTPTLDPVWPTKPEVIWGN